MGDHRRRRSSTKRSERSKTAHSERTDGAARPNHPVPRSVLAPAAAYATNSYKYREIALNSFTMCGRSGARSVGCGIQTMIDMVVNQPPLCFADRLLDRMQLLGKLEAAAAFIEHRDDAPHVPLRTLEAFDDVGMRLMNMCACHVVSSILPGGIRQVHSRACLKSQRMAHFLRSAERAYPLPPIGPHRTGLPFSHRTKEFLDVVKRSDINPSGSAHRRGAMHRGDTAVLGRGRAPSRIDRSLPWMGGNAGRRRLRYSERKAPNLQRCPVEEAKDADLFCVASMLAFARYWKATTSRLAGSP